MDRISVRLFVSFFLSSFDRNYLQFHLPISRPIKNRRSILKKKTYFFCNEGVIFVRLDHANIMDYFHHLSTDICRIDDHAQESIW